MAFIGLKKRGLRKVTVLLLLVTTAVVFYKLMSDFEPPDPKPDPIRPVHLSRDKANASRMSSIVVGGDLTRNSGFNRTNEYCNSPFIPVKGNEGLAPEGFTLQMVHVFTRHGDRTSIYTIPGYKPASFDCNFRKWYSELDDQNEKFRRFPTHMDQLRDPEAVFGKAGKLYPDKNFCSEQSLTNRGVLQHLNLGQFLNERYIVRNQLFDEKKSLKEQFHVRSTRTQRTFQSAVAFSYGFLPVFDTSDLSVSWSDDIFFCVARDKSCRCRYGATLYRTYHKVARPIDGNSSLRAEVLAKMLNVEPEHVRGLGHVLDAFLPTFCHNKGAICLNKPPFTCVDQGKVEDMWKEYIDAEIFRTDTGDPEKNVLKYSYLHLYPVLKEMMRRMQTIGQGQMARKFTLFSGHDITLMLLLNLLGVYDGMWSPYASRVVFELYDSSLEPYKGNLYLRFLYNGNDVTNDVTFCKGKLVESLCSFDRFEEFMLASMHDLFGKNSYKEACEMDGR